MEVTEIILLVAGGLIFILSFFIPDIKYAAGSSSRFSESEIRELVSRELESMKSHVDEMAEESVAETMEKTERALERLSNEKIMAVNEYSDTVLTEIHKNHEEAVFLYDMLNQKYTALKNTLADVNSAVKEAETSARYLQRLKEETGGIMGEASGNRVDEGFPKLESEQGRNSNVGIEAGGKRVLEADAGKTTVLQPLTGNSAVNLDLEEEQADSNPECNHNDKILQLYKQGKSAVVIARELGLGIGEVKLVIDLFRNQS